MKQHHPDLDVRTLAQEILGYLNFSSGAADVKFLKNLSDLFGILDRPSEKTRRPGVGWAIFCANSSAFCTASRTPSAPSSRPRPCCEFFSTRPCPAIASFTATCSFIRPTSSSFSRFSSAAWPRPCCGRAGRGTRAERIVRGAIAWLNDYLGHRPVAVLHNEQKIQPYEHEWVRPIPLYIQGAGVAYGPYRELVETALAILRETDPAIFFDAHFPLEQLDELAFDPRAYDFDHPVNKRPNYLFGQWDLQHLDNAGRCRRFVLQQVALDGMLDRLARPRQAAAEGSAVRGSGRVGGHDADGLGRQRQPARRPRFDRHAGHAGAKNRRLPRRLLRAAARPPERAARRAAAKEATALQQPFGGARQHFNHYLARRRAQQLQHVHLAVLFARMGYAEAAERQVRVLPVASARMSCDIQCRITAAHRSIDAGRLEPAVAFLGDIEDLLRRGIECGALVDPWNMLGFGGQFSLFPSPENSVHDHRVDELIDMIKDIFALYVRLRKEAAARGEQAFSTTLAERTAASCRLVGPIRLGRGQLGRGLLGPRNARIDRPRLRRAAGLARGRRGGRRHRLLARPRRTFQLAQGLLPGHRYAVGAPRPGGRHGAA